MIRRKGAHGADTSTKWKGGRVSTFRIVPYFLILLIPLFYSVRMSWSGPGSQVKYAEKLNKGPIRTAQMLKEISEQEHRTAAFINAARVGDTAKVDKFLREGMDINAKNKSGNTALMEACAYGQEDIINLLLDRQADSAVTNNIGETATAKAVRAKQYRAIDLLRTRKAIQTKGIYREIIKYADADFVESEFGRWSEADRKLVLANMMREACMSGKTEVVKFFLDKGADPNQDKGRPLCTCSGASGSPVEAVQLLLDRGADPNLWEKESPLNRAVGSNRPDVVRLLVERGAKINAQGEKGKTPLIEAMGGGSSMDPILKILLEKGADIRLTDESGYTALMRACGSGRVQAVRLLLDKGANVNVKIKDGSTPLHEAARKGSVEMVELLLQRGADAKAKTAKGNTPLDMASQKGHKNVEALLRRHRTR
jgi:ankyrin repeat protein